MAGVSPAVAGEFELALLRDEEFDAVPVEPELAGRLDFGLRFDWVLDRPPELFEFSPDAFAVDEVRLEV